MVPSALDWFIRLGTQFKDFSNPPIDALDLCKALSTAVQSKNDKLQVNRAFNKFRQKLPVVSNWINSQFLFDAIYSMKSQPATDTYSEVVEVLEAIIEGETPSTKWKMEAQRGVNSGFSRTLEASALVGYLTKIEADDWLPENIYPDGEDLSEEYLLLAYAYNNRDYQVGKLFTQAKALEIASALFQVNEDNIRKYATLSPINDQSETAMALFALVRMNATANADKYFDVDEMVESAKSNPVTI